MKRSNGPNMDSLNRHSPVLKILIWLAPNGYPDPYKLRDLLVQLHGLFKILDPRSEGEANLSLGSVAILASDRWRIMCKHCLMLVKGKQYIPNDFVQLKECLAAIRLENPTETPQAAPADTPATSASSNENESSSAAWAASQAASPAASQAAPAVSWWEQPVPWKGGVIDWEQVEDSIPIAESDDELECEIASIDFTKALPSGIHPYYHPMPDSDCCIVAHKCNCPICLQVVELSSPVRKRSKHTADSIEVEASPAPPAAQACTPPAPPAAPAPPAPPVSQGVSTAQRAAPAQAKRGRAKRLASSHPPSPPASGHRSIRTPPRADRDHGEHSRDARHRSKGKGRIHKRKNTKRWERRFCPKSKCRNKSTAKQKKHPHSAWGVKRRHSTN